MGFCCSPSSLSVDEVTAGGLGTVSIILKGYKSAKIQVPLPLSGEWVSVKKIIMDYIFQESSFHTALFPPNKQLRRDDIIDMVIEFFLLIHGVFQVHDLEKLLRNTDERPSGLLRLHDQSDQYVIAFRKNSAFPQLLVRIPFFIDYMNPNNAGCGWYKTFRNHYPILDPTLGYEGFGIFEEEVERLRMGRPFPTQEDLVADDIELSHVAEFCRRATRESQTSTKRDLFVLCMKRLLVSLAAKKSYECRDIQVRCTKSGLSNADTVGEVYHMSSQLPVGVILVRPTMSGSEEADLHLMRLCEIAAINQWDAKHNFEAHRKVPIFGILMSGDAIEFVGVLCIPGYETSIKRFTDSISIVNQRDFAFKQATRLMYIFRLFLQSCGRLGAWSKNLPPLDTADARKLAFSQLPFPCISSFKYNGCQCSLIFDHGDAMLSHAEVEGNRARGTGSLGNVYHATSPDLSYSVVVKFVSSYGEAAHRYLAGKGFAPDLLACVSAPGGGRMVVMKAASGADLAHVIWLFLSRYPKSTLAEVERALAYYLSKLHKSILELHKKGFVHGDIRAPNVLVEFESDTTPDRLLNSPNGRVLLIDFDWSGLANRATYLSVLNRAAGFPKSAIKGGLITKAHDLEMLEKICDAPYQLFRQSRSQPR